MAEQVTATSSFIICLLLGFTMEDSEKKNIVHGVISMPNLIYFSSQPDLLLYDQLSFVGQFFFKLFCYFQICVYIMLFSVI